MCRRSVNANAQDAGGASPSTSCSSWATTDPRRWPVTVLSLPGSFNLKNMPPACCAASRAGAGCRGGRVRADGAVADRAGGRRQHARRLALLDRRSAFAAATSPRARCARCSASSTGAGSAACSMRCWPATGRRCCRWPDEMLSNNAPFGARWPTSAALLQRIAIAQVRCRRDDEDPDRAAAIRRGVPARDLQVYYQIVIHGRGATCRWARRTRRVHDDALRLSRSDPKATTPGERAASLAQLPPRRRCGSGQAIGTCACASPLLDRPPPRGPTASTAARRPKRQPGLGRSLRSAAPAPGQRRDVPVFDGDWPAWRAAAGDGLRQAVHAAERTGRGRRLAFRVRVPSSSCPTGDGQQVRDALSRFGAPAGSGGVGRSSAHRRCRRLQQKPSA